MNNTATQKNRLDPVLTQKEKERLMYNIIYTVQLQMTYSPAALFTC